MDWCASGFVMVCVIDILTEAICLTTTSALVFNWQLMLTHQACYIACWHTLFAGMAGRTVHLGTASAVVAGLRTEHEQQEVLSLSEPRSTDGQSVRPQLRHPRFHTRVLPGG